MDLMESEGQDVLEMIIINTQALDHAPSSLGGLLKSC
jgi:hypothetical protein